MNINRYSGQIALREISISGQKKLSQSMVTIVGIGGNGSVSAELFARMGIGKLRIVDDDVVRENNLHRQFLYGESSVGKQKVVEAAGALKLINREMQVEVVNKHLDAENVSGIIEGSSLVYDGTDNFAARFALNRACVKLGIPFVMTSSLQYWGEVIPVVPGKTACLDCLNIPKMEEGSCSQIGIFPPAVSMTASIGVSTSVSILMGSEITGFIKIADSLKNTVETIETQRNPDCRTCGNKLR